VAQTQNEHLTSEQLSASLDKQLSPQEQAVFDAHIASCQQCQHRLADFRLAATLLHALPQEAVPRSFVLPTSVSLGANQATPQKSTITPLPLRRPRQNTALRRSIRIISTLAAVLALCFIISGMLPFLISGSGYSASTSSGTSSSGGSTTLGPEHPSATASGAEQPNRVLQQGEATAKAQATATAQARTPASTASPAPNNNHATNPNTGNVPFPTMDLSQPATRLGIGIVVLALSIIILILTRRRRVVTP
jgi:anti-sigma factor RsiW